jgi:outer membrane protein assembly factor BamB
MTNADCPFTFLKPGECVDPPPATTGQCWLERSITCTSNADCPACVPAVGGGVTATASVSPDGKDVYMSSVGCLSRPSVGDSDSIFKLDAATGAVEWVYRTEGIEQFTFWPGGPTYHDYGFLNGPILADVTEGMGTHAVAVGGGRDGTMYAVDQQTGALVWHNTMASPPPFAGFGLFDGALAYDKTTDRFLAALDDISTYSGTDHMFGFTGADGTIAWSDEIGQSWSSVTVANGMVFAGTLSASVLYAYDIQSGARLATLTVPAGTVMGGAAIDNGVIYVPYGDPFSSNLAHGGVVAYGLPPAP